MNMKRIIRSPATWALVVLLGSIGYSEYRKSCVIAEFARITAVQNARQEFIDYNSHLLDELVKKRMENAILQSQKLGDSPTAERAAEVLIELQSSQRQCNTLLRAHKAIREEAMTYWKTSTEELEEAR